MVKLLKNDPIPQPSSKKFKLAEPIRREISPSRMRPQATVDCLAQWRSRWLSASAISRKPLAGELPPTPEHRPNSWSTEEKNYVLGNHDHLLVAKRQFLLAHHPIG
jgi:hypothetical protein